MNKSIRPLLVLAGSAGVIFLADRFYRTPNGKPSVASKVLFAIAQPFCHARSSSPCQTCASPCSQASAPRGSGSSNTHGSRRSALSEDPSGTRETCLLAASFVPGANGTKKISVLGSVGYCKKGKCRRDSHLYHTVLYSRPLYEVWLLPLLVLHCHLFVVIACKPTRKTRFAFF
jgi:hypothetical protein